MVVDRVRRGGSCPEIHEQSIGSHGTEGNGSNRTQDGYL